MWSQHCITIQDFLTRVQNQFVSYLYRRVRPTTIIEHEHWLQSSRNTTMLWAAIIDELNLWKVFDDERRSRVCTIWPLVFAYLEPPRQLSSANLLVMSIIDSAQERRSLRAFKWFRASIRFFSATYHTSHRKRRARYTWHHKPRCAPSVLST